MSDKIYESGEDYLETILRLSNRQGKVKSIDIANEMEYSKPSVSRAMKILQEKGYVLAVVTNKPTRHVQPVLAAFGIDHLFSEMLGGQSLPAIKPHPGPLYYLCGKFGFEPRQVLFVGDSKNDIIAGHAAGCAVVGLTYGYNYNIPISESNPDWVFDDFAQLLTIL